MSVNSYQSILNMDEMLDEAATSRKQNRPRRSPTTLKLQWIAERVRRCEKIKKQLHAGTYHVDSRAVARSILILEEEKAAE